jgi:hypothetical protein
VDSRGLWCTREGQLVDSPELWCTQGGSAGGQPGVMAYERGSFGGQPSVVMVMVEGESTSERPGIMVYKRESASEQTRANLAARGFVVKRRVNGGQPRIMVYKEGSADGQSSIMMYQEMSTTGHQLFGVHEVVSDCDLTGFRIYNLNQQATMNVHSQGSQCTSPGVSLLNVPKHEIFDGVFFAYIKPN